MYKVLSFGVKNWPLILIIVISFLLRIYKIEELFYFTYDEAVPAFIGRRLLLWHHLPLIGGVTPFGVHLTPYFYWFLSLILSLGKLNPIIWGYLGAIISMLTILLIYSLGASFANKRVALTASIFWGFSYLANVYDRHLWALYWGPLLSLTCIFALHKIVKGSQKFVFVLALVLVIGISTDPSNLVFIFLTTLVWIIYKIPITKTTYLAIFMVLFSLMPLAIFDLKHNFANTKPFTTFFERGSNSPGFKLNNFYEHLLIFPNAFARLIYTFGDNQVAKNYSYCQSYVQEKYREIPISLTIATALVLIYFIYWSFRKNKNTGWKLTVILLALYVFGIQLYGTIFKADIFEHYIVGAFPILLLILAKFVSSLPKRLWIIILAMFISLNLLKLLNSRNSHGLKYKIEAIEFTTNATNGQAFSLESLSTCWRLSGYRYLFTVFGKEPVKSYVDPYLGYLYGSTPIADKHPNLVVTFVTHDFINETDDFYKRYALFKSHEKTSSIFGNIEVIMMDNTTKWFDKEN